MESDPIHPLRDVYMGDNPDQFAFTRELTVMSFLQRSGTPYVSFSIGSCYKRFLILINHLFRLYPLIGFFKFRPRLFHSSHPSLSVLEWIRSQLFTRDLSGIGSKHDHFRRRCNYGMSRSTRGSLLFEFFCRYCNSRILMFSSRGQLLMEINDDTLKKSRE